MESKKAASKFPIDLSMLTPEELEQFKEDPSALLEGDTDVCLYLRYSSDKQSDQSIEGQFRDCRAYCKANRYRITGIYVDRAHSASKDIKKRVHLMELVSDSEKTGGLMSLCGSSTALPETAATALS